MRRLRLALPVLASLLLAASLVAAEDPISGKWTGSADSPQGSVSLNLTLRLDGEAVTGEIGSDQGSQPIKDGTYKSAVLTFTTSYNGVPVVMKGSIKDGKIVGDFSYNAGEVLGTWEVARAAAQ
jgi:hypothetical protein